VERNNSGLWVPPSNRTSTFKKADPPVTGEIGKWQAEGLQFATLPGGGVLQFDLSRLTLSDYRQMRDHYQINSNLSLLTFMIHQIEWRIECDNKAIADEIESQLRPLWATIVRGFSQAFWAGFSPMVLQFENDIAGRRVVLDKVKDLMPEITRVNWKEVKGYNPNRSAVNSKYKVYDGIQQEGTSHPIPVDNCVHPDTLILCDDLLWRPAGTLLPGDGIIAFDEDDGPRGRQYRSATIVENRPGSKPSVTIEADRGEPITASVDHPFLVRVPNGKKSKDCWEWRDAADLQPGDRIAYFGDPWGRDESREAGWLAGMFDGEGCLGNTQGRVQLSITQNHGPVLDHLKSALDARGYVYSVTENKRDTNVQLVVQGGRRAIMRFLAEMAPDRFMARNIEFLWDGVWIKLNKSVDLATVTEVREVGEQPVASIQTSCGTFITGGFLSHNTLWYPLLMENGDHYGKKLLRPAFVPWFFSMLIHLYANRYFERFGEPLPIGRADYDASYEIGDRTVSGREAMENILLALRSRSVVTLPSDRDENGNFDFDLEYLESQMRGADFDRYLNRLDEEISLGLFTPILMLRTVDVGSYNLGINHMQVWMWMLNAIAADLKIYLDNYLIQRLKAFNFSPNAPRAQWVPRPLGKQDTETMRAVITTMMRDGKVAPADLVELGQALGLTLKEVREVTTDEPDDDEQSDDDERIGRPERTPSGGPRVENSRGIAGEMQERVRGQVQKAFREGTFGTQEFAPNLGFRRRFEMALTADGLSEEAARTVTAAFYRRIENWLEDFLPLGERAFSTPAEFMSSFERVLNAALDEVA
jgi:hypothetical protein